MKLRLVAQHFMCLLHLFNVREMVLCGAGNLI